MSPECKIDFFSRSGGLLEVRGTGVLGAEDTAKVREKGEEWAERFTSVSIASGITGIENGFLEIFKNVSLIRGEYNSFAEGFAEANGLRFLHCDIPVAEDVNESRHEKDEITLRFHPDACPDILHDIYGTGSSAGSYGGGQVVNELPGDFYVGCTVEKFAANFPERLRGQITGNQMLKRFLEAANSRENK